MKNTVDMLLKCTKKFSADMDKQALKLKAPEFFIYNPLSYAWDMHKKYIENFARKKVKILFLGMNPGPFGMVQDGIPFGEVGLVKNFLHIEEAIQKPQKEHASRPILGLDSPRSEISGLRFWSLMQDHYHSKEALEGQLYVANYCPLAFLSREKRARNITPDKLNKAFREELEARCDQYLLDTITLLSPQYLVGIGGYATKKLKKVTNKQRVIHTVLHPSPASPLANKGWADRATEQLCDAGIWDNKGN